MNRNRIRICGRKTTTLPTPATTPSATKLANAPSPRFACSHTPSDAVPSSMASMSGAAQAKTAWKTTAMTTNRPIVPGSGRFMKRAKRVPQVVITGACSCTSAITSRTQE